GVVKVKVNGKQEVLEIKIDKECVDPNDVESLEELVLTAVNNGLKESQDMVQQAMSKVTGGMNIPGLF
ncbi:MAG TPA: YbaB/EbfC family nucleoid-associated protein, partial [Bacteriovoracaceae bacterium]|nr:YbaB/EbfC family nucleoid-associated protein [Bacteriovoracaceae bacterium]